MSLHSSCMGAIEKDAILEGYTAASDMITPFCTACTHSMRDNPTHMKSVALTVSLGERNMVWRPSPDPYTYVSS